MRKENVEANSSAGDGTAPSSSKKSPVFGDLPCTLENLPKFAEAAKTTDNKIDDQLVEAVKKAFFD